MAIIMKLKSNSYRMSISRCDLVYLSTPTFLISILHKQFQMYLLLRKSLKSGWNSVNFQKLVVLR